MPGLRTYIPGEEFPEGTEPKPSIAGMLSSIAAKASAWHTLRAPSSVVEHVTFNHGVPSSILGGPTN
jgi:hypothetical protein